MSFSQYDTVSSEDYNQLFTQLEAIRKKHAARKGLTATQSTKLADKTLGGNVNTVTSGESQTIPENVEKIKKAVNFLAANAPNLKSFTSKTVIPSQGDLLKAIELDKLKEIIDKQNAQCANCSFNSSFNSSHNGANYGSHFGSFNSSWNGQNC